MCRSNLSVPVPFLGEDISAAILSNVHALGIDMKKCRGQAYDGASNMSGGVRGCAALIKDQYPLAVYQHCRSHCLNLCIMKVSKSIPEISKLKPFHRFPDLIS